MSRHSLQQFEHDRSSYERPNADWVCGRAACGRPCGLGPDHKGGCHTTGECVPTKRDDRWVCSRPGTIGGACTPGPRPDGSCCRPIVPCTPVRSLRAVRGSIVRWSAAVSLGLVLIMLGLPNSGEVFTPGPLSSNHGSLMTRDISIDGATQCSACHADSSSTVAEIISSESEANATSGVGPVLSEKCLDCHPMGAHAMRAHALSDAVLRALSETAAPSEGGVSLSLQLARGVDVGVHRCFEDGDPIECVACHSEHHGRTADIAHLSAQQCQTCHSEPFGTFANGHPEFTDYPYENEPRVHFNHATHIQTHFRSPEHQDKPFACMTCHVSDEQGGAMLVRGYEASCMSCHEDQIAGVGRSSVQGVPFFTLPAMDVRSLEDADRWIGVWPADSAVYSGGLTPFMRLLLASDEHVAAAVARTDERALRDLYEADDATLADAEAIAWGVKRLVHDVLAGGQREVLMRLETALGRPMTSAERGRVLAGLPVDAMARARDAWFPDLHMEVAMHNSGRRPVAPTAEPERTPLSDGEDGDTDSASGDLFGDDLLGGDDDLLGGGDDLLGGDDDLLEGGDDLLVGGDDLLGGDDDLLGGGDDLLAGDDDLMAGDDDLLGGDDDLLGGDDDLLGGSDDLAGGDDGSDAFEPEPFVMLNPQEWVQHGGWFMLDGAMLSLVYRPTGHADPFMRAWLDVSIEHPSNGRLETEPALDLARAGIQDVFETLSDRNAPGACMKCHAADTDRMRLDGASVSGTAAKVHWMAIGPDPEETTFTRFEHAPHLTDLGDNACFTCHNVAPLISSAAPDQGIQRCFAPMSIEGCQSCHNPSEVDTSCLGCHNYHVGVRSVRAWGGSLDTMPESQPEPAAEPESEGATDQPGRDVRKRFWQFRALAQDR